MNGRILDIDGDVITTYHEQDGKSIVKTTQDVSPYLEKNLISQNNASENWKGTMHHVASIPLSVAEQWHRELGSDPFARENKAWLTRRLNSPEFAKLRTKKGRI